MVEILWHGREASRQTEKTNLNLLYQDKPVYSTQKGFYHRNVKSKIFHRPSYRHYNCKSCTAVFETKGEATQAKAELFREIKRLTLVDLLEREEKELPFTRFGFILEVKPFEIVTLKLKF